ncbi:hypothetical protein ASG81_08785 [Paenibacillus sp. Soil522]|nr:hypothetical protein ASG81_08785 [Paenibacillus sp. Soil522]
MKQALFITVIAAYLISEIYPSRVLEWIVSALCLVIVVIVFRSIKLFVQILGAIFLSSGFILLASDIIKPAIVRYFH